MTVSDHETEVQVSACHDCSPRPKDQSSNQYGAEEKFRIVLEGLRGEYSIAELCRHEGIAKSLYCEWSQEFLEASRKRLVGDTERKAISRKGKELRRDIGDPKKALTEILLENGIPKKA